MAGAFATRLLADPARACWSSSRRMAGGSSRSVPRDRPDPERGGLHLALDAGKESVALDLSRQNGQRSHDRQWLDRTRRACLHHRAHGVEPRPPRHDANERDIETSAQRLEVLACARWRPEVPHTQ